MNGFALLVATAVMGVDYGWEPDTSGELEYIIQIEPMTLIALREGHDIVSQIDPYVRNVKRFRIQVGSDPVPRRGFPPTKPAEGASAPAPPGVAYGWQPVDQNQIEFVVQISNERLMKLHGGENTRGEDITGKMPIGLGEIVRLRIQSETGAEASKEPPAGTEGVSGTVGDAPATGAPAPWVAEQSHEWSQLWAIAPDDVAAAPNTVDESRQNAATLPERAMVSPGSGAASRYGQLDPRYQSLTDRGTPNGLSQAAPRNEVPLSSLPVPGINNGQGSGTFQPRTAERERSVYDQRGHGWEPPNQGSPVTTDMPRRIDAGQLAGPRPAFPPDPRTEYSPHASYPNTYTPPRQSESSHLASNARSFADRNQTLRSDANAIEEDRQYFGVPDSLASALGFEPWPNRVVSYDVDVTPASPAPKDFWSSLSEVANDRSLDYLKGTGEEEGEKPWWPFTLAALGLFASLGANLYMGWIVAGTYRKYLDLADDMDEGDRRDYPADDREEDSWSPRRHRRERRTVDV